MSLYGDVGVPGVPRFTVTPPDGVTIDLTLHTPHDLIPLVVFIHTYTVVTTDVVGVPDVALQFTYHCPLGTCPCALPPPVTLPVGPTTPHHTPHIYLVLHYVVTFPVGHRFHLVRYLPHLPYILRGMIYVYVTLPFGGAFIYSAIARTARSGGYDSLTCVNSD